MRTIVFEEPYSITIRVEGDLTAEAARELSFRVAKWREMTAEKKMRLDLGDVSAVDSQGAAWLRDVSERGVGFSAVSPAVRRVTASFARETKEDLRTWLSRIGIRLSTPPTSARMGFFRRIVCAILPEGTAGCPCER